MADKLVEIFVPKIPGEAPELYVSINDYSCLIPRGKKSKVPEYVAKMLEYTQKAQDEADEFSAKEQKKMKVIQGVDA